MKPFVRMILVTTLALAAGCASALKVDNAPVSAFDLNRYLGERRRGYDTGKLIWAEQK